MQVTESREELVGSEELRKSRQSIQSTSSVEHVLTPVEKTFLLHAERGDCATVKK